MNRSIFQLWQPQDNNNNQSYKQIKTMNLNFESIAFYSLLGNIILLFILFSPNLNYFFNKRWFKWRDEDKNQTEK